MGRFFDGLDGKAGILSLGPGRTALAKTDDNVAARVVQVQGVCVTLAAVADDGNLLTLDERKIGVLVVKDFHVWSPF